MKKLLLLLTLIWSGFTFAQGEYDWGHVTNPDFNAFDNSDVVMRGGKLYQTYDSSGYILKVAVYDPATSTWTRLARISGLATSISNMQAKMVGDKIYILTQGYDAFILYSFDFTNNQLQQVGASMPTVFPGNNWKFVAGDSNSELLVLRNENYDNMFLSRYNTANSNWDSWECSTLLNPSSADVSTFQAELYLTNGGDIYCGLSGPVNRLVQTTMADPSAFTVYNTAGTNNGALYIDGSEPTSATFYFTGDGQNTPMINLRSGALLKTWQIIPTNIDINVLTAVTTPLDYNVQPDAYFAVHDPAYAFVVSNFVPLGGGPADNFHLNRQDLGGAMDWEFVGPKIESGFPSLYAGTVRGSLDDLGQHFAVQYGTQASFGAATIKVLNRKPQTDGNDPLLNTGLCLGHYNELYPLYELHDADVEHVRVTSVTSLNGVLTNLSAIAIGEDLGSNPSISKFKIYGTITGGGSDAVIITYTDGWNTISDTLPLFNVANNAPNVAFTQSPLYLCDNENMIELENYVNTTGEGVFTLNGTELTSSTINGITESVQNPNGTIYYRVNVDGCFVETGVSFSFVEAGTASAITTDVTCGNADGTATVTFVNGTSSDITFEWSTGETGATIGNLAAGAYYYGVTDEYGCHTTGFASVEATGLDVTVTPTPMTCAGANDASLEVNVSGAADYSVLWSNGYSTDLISNLAAGTYEVTVTTPGCQAVYSYQVADVAPITATLTAAVEPGCGLSNGVVNGTYSGGTGGYTYDWIGQGQTTANLTGVPYGYYEVAVSDASGCADTFGIHLNNFGAVNIADSIIPTACEQENGAILTTLTAHPSGNPPSSINWSNGNPFEDNFNLAAGFYTITVASLPVIGTEYCYASKTMAVGVRAPLRQEICLVTVDTATSTNLVVWEKLESDVHHYNIYRENAVAGMYMLIDTVMYDSESLFNDVVASPADRSWRYKISAVNECGIESPISAPHKTVHLNSIQEVGGSMDIYWDDYEGLTAPEYVIWRHTDATGWEPLPTTVPFGTSYFNDVPPAGSTGLDYFVELVPAFTCIAEKAQDFNSSRSNKDRAQFNAGEGTGDSNNGIHEQSGGQVDVYPNPFEEVLHISITNATADVTIFLYSIDGHLITSVTLSNGIHQLDLRNLGAGVYFIRAGETQQLQRFIKQ